MNRNCDNILAIRQLASNLKDTPCKKISSPSEQPRRASVAIILRWALKSEVEVNADSFNLPKTVEEFFQLPWVSDTTGEPEIFYIKRASREGDRWSAQIAFPGGKNEDNETDKETAERETLEEVGLDLQSENFLYLGALDDREVTSTFGKKLILILSPHVYLQCSPRTPLIEIQDAEVASTHWIPLSIFLVESLPWEPVTIDIAGRLFPTICRSSYILNQLLHLVFGNMYFPAIDLAVAVNTIPKVSMKLWGLTMGMTANIIAISLPSHSINKVPFARIETVSPRFDFVDLNLLVALFMGLEKRQLEDGKLGLTFWKMYYISLRRALLIALVIRTVATGWMMRFLWRNGRKLLTKD